MAGCGEPGHADRAALSLSLWLTSPGLAEALKSSCFPLQTTRPGFTHSRATAPLKIGQKAERRGERIGV
jgi:hypothetical protein